MELPLILGGTSPLSLPQSKRSLIWLETPIQGGAAMPRYYLHIHNGYELELDTDGADFPDAQAARAEAERLIREVSRFWPQARRYMTIEIADEAGQTIVRLPFADVMGLPGLSVQSNTTLAPPSLNQG
jgi:hypothetical protein